MTANRVSVVLLAASYDPGWTATVDGVPVVPQMVAPALVGVEVAPGTHQVDFRYVGYSSYPLLFAAALLTVVAAGVLAWRRRPSSGLERDAEPKEPVATSVTARSRRASSVRRQANRTSPAPNVTRGGSFRTPLLWSRLHAPQVMSRRRRT